jgi:DNA-binding transcriptional LysR family regulator
VANVGSFTKAANELHISQPALSRRVSLLENSLGTPLFSRFMDRVQLTEAGSALVPYANAVVTALRDGIEAVRSTNQGERGQISLAIASPLLNSRVISVFQDFQRSSPNIELSLHSGTSAEVSVLVLRGDASLGLRYRMDPNPRMHSEMIGSEEMIIVCAPTHPLAGRKSVSPARLAAETWIAVPVRSDDPDGGFVNVLKQYGLKSGRTMVIDSTMAQKRLIEAGFGIGILAYGSVQEELASGRLVALSSPKIRTNVPVMLVHRKSMHVGPVARRIWEALLRAFPDPVYPPRKSIARRSRK